VSSRRGVLPSEGDKAKRRGGGHQKNGGEGRKRGGFQPD